jgi:hypothetical protein
MTIAPVDFSGDGFGATGATNNDVVGPYYLLGGRYALIGYSSGTYSVQLAALTLDSTNYMNLTAAASTAFATFDLPPGSYKITCGASMTTGNVALVRVPYRAA